MTAYLKIHRQVEVVELVCVASFNHLQDVCLGKTHWNVADHQCGERFLPIKHRKKVDFVVGRIAQGRFCGDRADHRFLVVVRILRYLAVLRVLIKVTFCPTYTICLVARLKSQLVVKLR